MKKIYRGSQIDTIVGYPVHGTDLYKFGIPYYCSSGSFYPDQLDRIDMMLAVAESHPEVHVVSILHDGRTVNRYEPNAWVYNLYYGNADPEIEFNEEFSWDDFPPEKVERFFEIIEDFANSPPTIGQIAAVNFALNIIRNYKKEE